MPIYEYVCPNCEFKFELLRPLSQASEGASCPRCQQSAERIMSVFIGHSTNDGGMLTTIGGNSCSSCGTTNCGTCGM